MNEYEVRHGKINVEDYQKLRKTTGWDPVTNESVAEALEKDLFSLTVLLGKEVVGMGRVIGDGAIYFYIQDVVVAPHHQARGVGKMIMVSIENYLQMFAPHNAFIGLMAAAGVKDFYLRYGYVERPQNRPGMYKMIKKK